MAFMMPVMKNEFDIYKGGRSRNTSECSNNTCRSRKVSETRSECPSLSTSPSTTDYSRSNYMNRNNSRAFSRTSSRTSQSSLTSPTKNCSPPKPSSGSQGSLNKFHVRLVDKLRKSFGKSRTDDRSWDEIEVDSIHTDHDDDLSSETSVAKQTLASSHQNDSTTATAKTLKKLSISSDSSIVADSGNDVGLGCSDSNLHIISSKPPMAPHQRTRSRSIETAAIKTTYRHSTGGRLWSRHFNYTVNSVRDYAEASKVKR